MVSTSIVRSSLATCFILLATQIAEPLAAQSAPGPAERKVFHHICENPRLGNHLIHRSLRPRGGVASDPPVQLCVLDDYPFATGRFFFELYGLPGVGGLHILSDDYAPGASTSPVPLLEFHLDETSLSIRHRGELLSSFPAERGDVAKINLRAEQERVCWELGSRRGEARCVDRDGPIYLAIPGRGSGCGDCGLPLLDIFLDSDEAARWENRHPPPTDVLYVGDGMARPYWITGDQRDNLLSGLQRLDTDGIPAEPEDQGWPFAMIWPGFTLSDFSVAELPDRTYRSWFIEQVDVDGVGPTDYLFALYHFGSGRYYDAMVLVRNDDGAVLQLLTGTRRAVDNLQFAIELDGHESAVATRLVDLLDSTRLMTDQNGDGVQELLLIEGFESGLGSMAEMAPVPALLCWDASASSMTHCPHECSYLLGRVVPLVDAVLNTGAESARALVETMRDEIGERCPVESGD